MESESESEWVIKRDRMEWGWDASACEAVRLRTHKVIHYTLIVYLPIVSLDKIDNSIANAKYKQQNKTKENFKILARKI